MADGIRIDDLNGTVTETRDHEIPAMKDGLTVKLTLAQILELIQLPDIQAFLTDENVIFSPGVTVGDVLNTHTTDILARLKRDGSNFANDAEKVTFRAAAGLSYADLPFLAVPVGGVLLLDTSITGVVEPSNASALYRFAKLTAGLTGGGAYNNGALTTESVTGSAPLVVATAVVSLAGSPINGQTISLLNTEGRYLKPGTSPGTVSNDHIQDHFHASVRELDGQSLPAGTNGSYSVMARGGTLYDGVQTSTARATNMRTDASTDVKRRQATAYMRLK